jgi:uncharacterized protein
MRSSTISPLDAAIVSAICFGFFIFSSTRAVLAGFPAVRFSDSGNSWMIYVEIVLAAAALLYLSMRNFDIASLYPAPSFNGTFAGLGIFIVAWLVGIVATAPFVNAESPQMSEFSNGSVSLASVILFAMVNGTFEEIFLLGVLVRGLRGYGLPFAVGISLLVRVLYHLYQGPLGAVWVLAFGTTFAFFYIRSKELWPSVLAHILWDIVPFCVAGGS